MNYIQIPVGIDYTVALGKHFAFIPFAGLYYAVGIGGKREVEDEKISIFKKEGGFAIVIAALIAISRLYLTVHYPTDVLVSLILGSIYGIISYYIFKFIMKKSEKMRKVFDEGAPYKTLFQK